MRVARIVSIAIADWLIAARVASAVVATAVAATLAVMVAGCSSPSRSSADPTPQPPPFPIGQVGVPVHVKAASGATADVTLNSATWLTPGGGDVIELTITGTSPRPFSYNEIYVVAGYGGGDQPFTHPNDDHWVGGSWGNYDENGKPPLRSGSVTAGQAAHGIVFYSMQSEG